MARVNVERTRVRAHWSFVRSADRDDALGGRDKLRRSSDRGGRAGLRACALSPLEIAESVRGGRVAAPGVSVTAHLPTIEHVSLLAVTYFTPCETSSLEQPYLNPLLALRRSTIISPFILLGYSHLCPLVPCPSTSVTLFLSPSHFILLGVQPPRHLVSSIATWPTYSETRMGFPVVHENQGRPWQGGRPTRRRYQ